MSYLSKNDSNQARFHSLTGLHDTTTDANNDDKNDKRKESTTITTAKRYGNTNNKNVGNNDITAARMCESYHDDDEKEEGYNSPVDMDIIDNHSPGPLSVSQSQWPHKFHLLTSMLRMIWREVSTARVQTNVKH